MSTPEGEVEFHQLVVPRHARVGVVGAASSATEAWLILHGYGMLAKGILHWFRAAERGHRQLIAPEALSRFYQVSGATRVVGASWMTREDREHEIADQHSYLDMVYEQHLAAVPQWQLHAFSQGVSTAFRWLLASPRRPGVLVCWGSHAPPDIDLARLSHALAGWQVHYAIGDRDRRVEPASMAADAERLRAAGIAVELHRFSGGHRIDDGVLADLEARTEPA